MSAPARKANLAFIGCGGHANYSLYPSIPQLETCINLVAVCDLEEQRAERVAHMYGVPGWYTDMDAMLEKESLDGVAVIGPPQMHVEVGSRVLQHGLPVFVEKPSAINVEEAVKLAQLADQNNTFGMVAFMKRFAVGYRMAKHLVEQPEFGGVQVIDVKFGQGPYPSIWGIESPALSFLTGQVIHIFDLVRHFAGDVEKVYSSYHEVTPTQFGFLINLVFRNGAIGMLNLNSLEAHSGFRDMAERMAMAGLENWVQVEDMLYLTYQSAKDWLEVPGLDIGRLHHTWRPTGPAARKTDELIGYRGELAHFAECVVSGHQPTPDLWDGAAALQITEAVWQSARTGDVVPIPTIRPA